MLSYASDKTARDEAFLQKGKQTASTGMFLLAL